MKKLILTIILTIAVTSAYGQGGYRRNNTNPIASFEIAPMILDIEGAKFGASLGVSIKNYITLSYFFVRDYKYGNNFSDGFYRGFHLSAAIPVGNFIEIGGGVRTGKLMTSGDIYAEKQGAIFTGEVRVKMTDSFKVALEYGKSNKKDLETGLTQKRNITSVRFIFSL